MSILKLKTAPTVEPIRLDEAQAHLRITTTDEDVLLLNLIKAARQHVETLCGPLITQSWYQYEDDWPAGDELLIAKPRLLTVVAVKYTDEDGVQATFAAANYTVAEEDEARPKIVLKDDEDWPSDVLFNINPIEIEFTCGYGATAETVPEPLKVAMLMLVAQWFENREPTSPVSIGTVPYSVDALLGDYRIWGF